MRSYFERRSSGNGRWEWKCCCFSKKWKYHHMKSLLLVVLILCMYLLFRHSLVNGFKHLQDSLLGGDKNISTDDEEESIAKEAQKEAQLEEMTFPSILNFKIEEEEIPETPPQSISPKRTDLLILASAQSERVFVELNEKRIYHESSNGDNFRGIHVVTVNQYNGDIIRSTLFNKDIFVRLQGFLDEIENGRIIVFLIGKSSNNVLDGIRQSLLKYGSNHIANLEIRDTWVFICKKGYYTFVETSNKNGSPSYGTYRSQLERPDIFIH